MRRRRLRGTRKSILVGKSRKSLGIFWAILNVFARREGLTPRAMLEQLSKKEPAYPPGQWHRWYKANHKRQRQMRAIKQRGGGWINPNTTGLPRYFVP